MRGFFWMDKGHEAANSVSRIQNSRKKKKRKSSRLCGPFFPSCLVVITIVITFDSCFLSLSLPLSLWHMFAREQLLFFDDFFFHDSWHRTSHTFCTSESSNNTFIEFNQAQSFPFSLLLFYLTTFEFLSYDLSSELFFKRFFFCSCIISHSVWELLTTTSNLFLLFLPLSSLSFLWFHRCFFCGLFSCFPRFFF